MENNFSPADSGLLELYVLGVASEEERRQVEELAAKNPSVAKELDEISRAMEEYATAHAVTPPATARPMMLATIDYMERLKKGEIPSSPPLLHKNSTPADYKEWIDREDLQEPDEMDEIFLKIIGYSPEVSTAIVWIKNMSPEEVHHDQHESFLILEGTCDITIDDEVHSLQKGDVLTIPLHANHFVKVTSPYPCKVILERKVA
jgi:mannose-6-phosphate isomerase-like protein (cupin superfamily)